MSFAIEPERHQQSNSGNFLAPNPGPNPDISPAILFESFQNEEVNQGLVQAVEATYRPLLKLMKAFGLYFEDVSLRRVGQNSSLQSTSFKHKGYISRIYCGFVVTGLWFHVVVPLVSVFLEPKPYLFLLFVIWHLLAALVATICLIVLPLRRTSNSRFQIFLSKVIKIKTNTVNLKKAKAKGRNHLILFSCFFVCSIAGTIVMDKVVNINFGSYKPWYAWYGFRITAVASIIIGCGIWVLPLIFFCLSCLIMEALFDDLYTQMPVMEFTELKKRLKKLCEVVELADRMFSPIFFVTVGLYITIMCFNFYHIVNLPQENRFTFLSVTLFWVLVTAALLAIIMVFGSTINEKVRKQLMMAYTYTSDVFSFIKKNNKLSLFTPLRFNGL